MVDKNKQADEILRLLGQEISEARFNEMTPSEEKKENERIKTSVKRRKTTTRLLKVCCIVICVLVGATIITTATSEAFRIKVFGFLFEENDGYVEMKRSNEQQILYPTYLPEGYEKISEGEFGNTWEINYQKEGSDDFITISEEFGTSSKMTFDNETTNREQCLVGVYEAYYFSGFEENVDNLHVLIWQQDGVFIEITTVLEKEEIIKIGNSLK